VCVAPARSSRASCRSLSRAVRDVSKCNIARVNVRKATGLVAITTGREMVESFFDACGDQY